MQEFGKQLRVRAPRKDEFEAWFRLYETYAVAVGSPVTRDIAVVIWRWISFNEHGVQALVAERDGTLVGFTHFRSFPRTLDANEACYLDDIFVTDDERGGGTARALVDAVVQIGASCGWTHVRWVTVKDNERAQRFYRKFAEDLELITYRIPCRSSS